jgi:hypothetical protein
MSNRTLPHTKRIVCVDFESHKSVLKIQHQCPRTSSRSSSKTIDPRPAATCSAVKPAPSTPVRGSRPSTRSPSARRAFQILRPSAPAVEQACASCWLPFHARRGNCKLQSSKSRSFVVCSPKPKEDKECHSTAPPPPLASLPLYEVVSRICRTTRPSCLLNNRSATYWFDVVSFLTFADDPHMILCRLQDVTCKCKTCVDMREQWEQDAIGALKGKKEALAQKYGFEL